MLQRRCCRRGVLPAIRRLDIVEGCWMRSKSYGDETGYVDSRGDLHRAWSRTCPATHYAGFRMNSLVRQRFYCIESSLTTVVLSMKSRPCVNGHDVSCGDDL